MKMLLLGAGRVGDAIARDLAAEAGMAAHRRRPLRRRPGARRRARAGGDRRRRPRRWRGDHRAAAGFDLVVGALPSFLGRNALEAVLEAGRDYVDISFFEEDPFALAGLARERGCTAVVDCGVAPGCDNLILGYLTTRYDRVERFVCYVGGLPTVRTLPWEYKAPFAPYDVLNEYLRPARWTERGEIRTTPPLTDLEHLEFAGVGTLEAFLTDGLRTLLTTVDVPDMKEKTLRYPGHAEKISLLLASGFLGERAVEVAGGEVTPLALASTLLFPHWELRDDEEDVTVMRVLIEGARGDDRIRTVYDLVDRRDSAGVSAMARTTGFTCAAIARLVATGAFRRAGVWAPEHVGQTPGCYERVLGDLAQRGIRFAIDEGVMIDDQPPHP